VQSISELDPKRFGIIVSRGFRRGLLLPNLDGVNDVETQLRIAKQKAGIPVDDDDVKIERFEVVRHK
jgi:AMMECR1 domain-containing protein